MHNLDGQVEEVSLRDLFARAHELRSVLGEIPTQTFALVRLALAILHRAVDGPPGAGEWAALWREPTLPVEDVSYYLDRFRARFDLLSPGTPFYQVAGLRTEKGDFTKLDRLIADVPANTYFFTTRLGPGIDRLGFAEAARWVVHCQAFDPSGIKSGAVGDPRVKGGKGYPIGTGWAGMLGGVLVEGRTLRETLLLNLVPDHAWDVPPAADDLPAWERDPQDAWPEFPDGYQPTGPLQLYTWQSRRIKLCYDSDGVSGVLIANGDRLTSHNQFRVEPMSVWRRSRAQEKKTGKVPTYLPRMHDPERAIWRGLAALLEDNRPSLQGKEGHGHLRPAVLDWIDRARAEDLLSESYQMRARTIGMLYGSQSATTAEVIDDVLALSVVLLGEAGQELRSTAIDAVRDAEAAAQALGELASHLAVAAGGEGGGPRDRARELGYAQLDHPFRRWLAGLGPDMSPAQARQQWQREADQIVRRAGRALVEQAGPAAWRGREATIWGKPRHVSTPEADNWFRGQLRKIFVFAHSMEKTEVPA